MLNYIMVAVMAALSIVGCGRPQQQPTVRHDVSAFGVGCSPVGLVDVVAVGHGPKVTSVGVLCVSRDGTRYVVMLTTPKGSHG